MDLDELHAVAGRLQHRRVLVVGDIMLDRYTRGHVRRVSPEAPVPVVERLSDTESLGGAANAAICVRALGPQVVLVGAVGDDPDGQRLSHLGHDGIELRTIRWHRAPTIIKHRIWADGQQLIRIDTEQLPPEPLSAEQVLAQIGQLSDFDAVLLSDYAKGVVTRDTAAALLGAARAAAVPVVVDPKVDDASLYAGCTLIKPNESEARRAFRFATGRDGEIDEIGEYLTSEVATWAAITRGAAGMHLFGPGVHSEFPVRARPVYDVTGAGDVVAAVFAAALGAGIDLDQACRLANDAASLAVSRVGTGAVTFSELEDEHGRD
jgi:D-beta-D-heptose 7-phosphate kinase/D-beta-D-heptose 1-phosphate adenosyltransferase